MATPITTRTDPFPNKGSKSWKLLSLLLNGSEVTPLMAILQLNLPTIQARASELRKMGWPVRVRKHPHPQIRGEEWDVYYFDEAFRLWLRQNEGKHPLDYPVQFGRGKFGED